MPLSVSAVFDSQRETAMSAEEKRLARWVVVAAIAGALLTLLLVHLGLPFTPMFATAKTVLPV
jgi:hypothetical protein